MRGVHRSIWCASFVIASAMAFDPAFAAAECGPLSLLTSLDIVTVSGGRPGVSALIGDKPVTLLVDTGGAFSMVSRRTVRELKLTVGQARVEIRNIAGQRSHEQVRLPSITLGRLRQEGAYFMVDPQPERPDDTAPGAFDGVLAPDFLMNVDADFDFGAKKLNLVSQNHCDGRVVYWSSPTVAIAPFRIDRNGHISFPMKLDDQRVNAILDTGAYNTALNLDVARRTFKVDPNARDVEKIGELNGGFTANIYRKRFKTLSIEGVTISNPSIDLLPDLMSGPASAPTATGSLIRDSDLNLPDVILGMSSLSSLHVYVAYKERKLYISAAKPQAQSVQ